MKKLGSICLILFLFLLSGCSNGSSKLSLESDSASSQTSEQTLSSSGHLSDANTPSSTSNALQTPPEKSEQGSENNPAQKNNPVGDLVGAVLEISPDGFTFSGSEPEISDDGAFATVGPAEQSINIRYSEDTVFQRCRYYTANDTSEILPATVNDVVPGITITLWGEYVGTDFVAQIVQVFEPIS